MTGPWRDLEQRLEFENEAERPLRESGEGESEGFEEAEAELIHQSEDPDLGRDPELDAIVEAEDAGSVYSEADEILKLHGVPQLTEITGVFAVSFSEPGACSREKARWIAEEMVRRADA